MKDIQIKTCGSGFKFTAENGNSLAVHKADSGAFVVTYISNDSNGQREITDSCFGCDLNEVGGHIADWQRRGFKA